MRSSDKKILALTVGQDGVASSRVRVGAPLSTLRKEGWQTGRVNATSRTWPLEFVARLIVLRPTVTIVQKVAPPPWFSRVVASLSRRLVFECDDAIQLGYGMDSVEAQLVSRRLRALLPLCDCIIVSNSVLGQDFQKLGARDAISFPGPAPAATVESKEERSGVLWLGSPSTILNVRTIVYPAFEFLAPTIKLTVVGATHNADDGRINELVWSYDVQAAALSRARVGVAPQALDAWSQRKAFYKVLEYLAASVVPVVPAHPAVRTLLGDELEIVAVTAQHETPAAWAAAITIALSIDIDEQWTAARERIFEKWSPDRLGRVMVGEEIS